jgi:hypothetical protein
MDTKEARLIKPILITRLCPRDLVNLSAKAGFQNYSLAKACRLNCS